MTSYDQSLLNSASLNISNYVLPQGDDGSLSLNSSENSSFNIFSPVQAGNISPFPMINLGAISILFQSLSNTLAPLSNLANQNLNTTHDSQGSIFNQSLLTGSLGTNTDIFGSSSSFNFGLPDYSYMGQYTGVSDSSPLDVKPSQSVTSGSSAQTTQYKIGKFDLNYWKSKGYDHEKGKELALDAYKVKKGKPGQCVGYTRETINRIYGTNFQNAGKAFEFGKNILSSPQLKGKFKKVDMKDVEKAGIPDGAIVLWYPGSPGFTKDKAAVCGHGGICYQNKVYSNYVESKHLSTCYEVWIPV